MIARLVIAPSPGARRVGQRSGPGVPARAV